MKIHDKNNTIWACIALVIMGVLLLVYGEAIRYIGLAFFVLAGLTFFVETALKKNKQ